MRMLQYVEKSRSDLIEENRTLSRKYRKTLDENIRLRARLQDNKMTMNEMATDIARLEKYIIEQKYKSKGETNG